MPKHGNHFSISDDLMHLINFKNPYIFSEYAGMTGFEPAVSALTGQCVNQATPHPQLIQYFNY